MAVAIEEHSYVVKHLRVEDRQLEEGRVTVVGNELKYVSPDVTVTCLLNTVQVHGVRKDEEKGNNLLYMQLESGDGLIGLETTTAEGDSDNDEESSFVEIEIAFSDYEAAQSVFKSVADAIRAWDDSHALTRNDEDDEDDGEENLSESEMVDIMQREGAAHLRSLQKDEYAQFEDCEDDEA